ncbi:hypothetical protein ACFYOT_26050 [Saccharothrix saharensis]|uniref:hypothetical protein n=1 Tax=Saccharothrix saharensis TaxID=571190 RepID=UPI0036C39CAB
MPTLLRVVTALSAVVTAVCAVVVAVVVVSGNAVVRVEQQRTFEPVDLSRRVLDLVVDRHPGSGISGFDHSAPPCPSSVAVVEGTTFTCTFSGRLGLDTDVEVRVTDTDSGALEVGEPKGRG